VKAVVEAVEVVEVVEEAAEAAEAAEAVLFPVAVQHRGQQVNPSTVHQADPSLSLEELVQVLA
jgi:hypothetical protein